MVYGRPLPSTGGEENHSILWIIQFFADSWSEQIWTLRLLNL